MARRYDTKTNMFSPEGRLYQVEYAMEAISHAGTSLGILASDGVVLAAEKKIVHKLLDEEGAEKIFRLNDNMACSVAGITSDANVLIEDLRHQALVYRLYNGDDVPCEQLVEHICNKKQLFTQVGGKRPFGVSLLYCGWDREHGFQLYQSDPSGNFSGWKATCIGGNHQSAVNLLKQEYKSPTLAEAKELTMKVLSKTMDVKLAAEKMEMMTLTRKDGATVIHILDKDELAVLVKAQEEREKAAAEAEKAKAEKASQGSS